MSNTDWERVRREAELDLPIPYDSEDGPYDPNDAEATKRFFANGVSRGSQQRAAGTGSVRLDLDNAVLEHFRGQGDDWRERIGETLKQYVEQQRLAKAS